MPQLLYDSDTFVVIHDVGNNEEVELAELAGRPPEFIELIVRHVYEIVDKRRGMAVCLHGPWAETFLKTTTAWAEARPAQEEVEHVLEGYAQLAHLPVALH